MSVCNLKYADSIISSVENFLYFSDLESFNLAGNISTLESHVLSDVPDLKEFSLSSYMAESPEMRQSIDNLFELYGVDASNLGLGAAATSAKAKSNATINFSSTEIVDLFHTLPILRSEFENKMNSEIIRNILIGKSDSETYVHTNEEVTKNLNAYKNSLFQEIQKFLIDKKVWKREAIDLYTDNDDVVDYTTYKEVMAALEKYFFSGDKFTMLETYSGKKIPNLDSSLKLSEETLSAYNAGVLLSNFDSAISTYYSDILDVNYNMFNDLRSNFAGENKYTLKIEGIKTDFWLGDSHASEGSESAESKLVKLLISTIPIYNKKEQKTKDFMEMKDFYLIAALVGNFEILHGNKLKNAEGSTFKFFNEEPRDALKWYINAITDAVANKPGSIPELKTQFQHSFEFIASIKNYIESEDFNIEIKEKNSDASILYIFSQIINNNFGAAYSKYNADGKYTVQEMYKQNFNKIQVQSQLFSKMMSNDKKDLYNEEKTKAALDLVFDKITGTAINDIKKTSISQKVEIAKLIRELSGINLSYIGIDDLIDDLVEHSDNKVITKVEFRNKFNSFIKAAAVDFKAVKEAIVSKKIAKVSKGDVTVSEYLENSNKDSFFIGLTNAYLANYVVKMVMNVETLTGEKLPTTKLATLTQKDAELFQQQREYEAANKANKSKAVFKSLLIQDTAAVLGTGTKLEAVNGDNNKSAVKFNIAENFTSDFQFDFLENLIRRDAEGNLNNKFAILIGNYSDKNTVLTKIINGKFKIGNKEVTKLTNEELITQVRKQGSNYYTDTVNKVIKDFHALLGTKSGGSIDADVTIINNALSKVGVRSLAQKASDLGINLTEQLHYSTYSGKTTLNQFLLDNYKIFSSEKLFKQFVARQESSMVDKYMTLNKGAKGKLQFTKGFELAKALEVLGLSDADFDKDEKGVVDYTALVNSKGETNPLLKKWMWLNGLFRNEYLFVSGKGEYMHSTKNIPARAHATTDKDWTEDRWKAFSTEMSGRLISMAKRNVMYTATIEVPVRKSKLGVPENVNMSVIEDYKSALHNISGNTHNQDIHDGSSYINYVYSLMVDNSYPDKGYSGTKKQFATFVTEYGNVIKKDAEGVITNNKIRSSKNSELKLYNKQKQMMDIPIGSLSFKFEQTFNNEFFYNKAGQDYRIDKLTITDKDYKMNVSKKVGEEWIPQSTFVKGTFNSLFDLWNAFGAEYSMDINGNLDEGSNELLYRVVTTADTNKAYPLKDKMIHIISNLSAVKTGGTNVNGKESWRNSEKIGFFTFKNRFMGPQLDASHEADDSQIKEVTQVISALAQNSKTAYLAQEAYNDIAMVIKKATEPYLKHMFPKNEKGEALPFDKKDLYQYLSDKFVKTIQNSKGDSIAKVLVQSFSKDVNIPFSNQNFYVAFVRDIITRMNNEFITRYYSGTGAVLLPSHGIIQVYDIPQADGTFRTVTQEDITKEALKNFDKNLEAKDNDSIVNTYIETLLAPTPTTWDKIQVGDTIQIELSSDEVNEIEAEIERLVPEFLTQEMHDEMFKAFYKEKSQIPLSSPEIYYKTKQAGNAPVMKVNAKPRDLKPTEITFSVNENGTTVQKSIFDTDSVRLRFKLSGFKEGFDVTSKDYIILNNFYKYVAAQEGIIPVGELVNDISSKLALHLSDLLNRWTQRNLELLDSGRVMLPVNETTDFNVYFNGDNLLMVYDDAVKGYNDTNTEYVSNYKFQEAELILGDIYQSKFNRGFHDSLYEIKQQGHMYFYDRLKKDFDNDATEADIKLRLTNLDVPVYIKYVDELPGNDYSLNIKAEKVLDSKEGFVNKLVRYNQKGEVVYTLPDYRNTRVRMVDGKETIFIKAVTSTKTATGEVLWDKVKDFNKNLEALISSCKGNIQSFIPLMNSGLDKTKIKLNKAGEKIEIKITFDYNTLQEFSRFSGYRLIESDIISKQWLDANKINILTQLSKKMYASWEKSHEVVAARIPSQSMQSFMPMKNIAYHKTKSNDAYVSIWQIWLQGSDFDIDKAYILGSGFNGNGHFDGWSSINNYSTKEQLDEIEKLPLPNGEEEFELGTIGPDITGELIAFHNANTNAEGNELSADTIKSLNKALRKVGKNLVVSIDLDKILDLYPGQEKAITDSITKLRKLITDHNGYKGYLRAKEAVKNSVVSRIKQIISMPSNQILATTPVDVQVWHDAAKLALDKKTTPPMQLSSYDMFSYYKQQRDAAVGKDDVGIAANGLKAMFALSSYFNNYYDNNFETGVENLRRSLKTFKKDFKFTDEKGVVTEFTPAAVSDVNLNQAQKELLKLAISDFETYRTNSAIALSSFTSAATDNAKELLMAKINANVELASMHIYLLILGFTPNQIANIMTSDVVEEIIEGLEVNIFFSDHTPKVNMIIGTLIDKYKKDPVKSMNLKSIQDIFQGAQETKILARMLSANQKTSANTKELNKFLTNFETAMYAREHTVFGEKLVDFEFWDTYKDSIDTTKAASAKNKFDKLVALVFEKNNQLDPVKDKKYVEDTLEKAYKMGVAGGKFDFREYIDAKDLNYKIVTKNYYNLIKNTFNMFDIIEEVPHFREMINGIILSHNMLKATSVKYNAVYDILKTTVRENANRIVFSNPEKNKNVKNQMGNKALSPIINDMVVTKCLTGVDIILKSKWLKTTKLDDYSFNVSNLLRAVNATLGKDMQIKKFAVYQSDDARNVLPGEVSNSVSEIKYITPDDVEDTIISTTTDYGIANFKRLMEEILLPLLQSKSNIITDSFGIQSVFNVLGIKGNSIVSAFPLGDVSNPVVADKAKKLLKAFNDLDISDDTAGMIKNSNGKPMKWRDMFYVYNLLVNNERYGDKRLTALFQDYIKEKNSLGYDYVMFSSKVDSGEVKLFDYLADLERDPNYAGADEKEKEIQRAKAKRELANDILFYSFNTYGKLSVITSGNKDEMLSVTNPDFVVVTSISETVESKKRWVELNEVLALLKSRGFIIKFECK